TTSITQHPPLILHHFITHATATPDTYTLSLHDALPISAPRHSRPAGRSGDDAGRGPCQRRPIGWEGGRKSTGPRRRPGQGRRGRSEEHTSELQSRFDLVCRLLLEKKNKSTTWITVD